MQRLLRNYTARNPGEDLPESWKADTPCEASGSEPPSLRRSNQRTSGGAAPLYQKADHVEAYWPDDDSWYPARVLKVKGNGTVLCIRFDGYSEMLEVSSRDVRIPVEHDTQNGDEEEEGWEEEEEQEQEQEQEEGEQEEHEEQVLEQQVQDEKNH
jgi:hypothetical protein